MTENYLQGVDALNILDLYDLDELQRLQDLFSEVHDVASIITYPDGTPITKPSNFCRLCKNIIRSTEKGRINCYKSDCLIGEYNGHGPNVNPCINAGLLDAGVSIQFNNVHLGTWIIGQVKVSQLSENKIAEYAHIAGVDREEFKMAYNEIPLFSESKFRKVAEMLYVYVNQLTENSSNRYLLDKANSELKHISHSLPEITWKGEWDFGSMSLKKTYISDVAEELLYLPKNTIRNSFNKFYSFVLPEYHEGIKHAILLGLKNPGKIYSYSFQIIRNDGEIRWFESKGRCYKTGQKVEIFGLTQDITKQKVLEEKYRNLVEHLPSGVAVYKPINGGEDFMIIDFNSSAELITNSNRDDVVGQTLLSVFPKMKDKPLFQALCEVNRTGKEVHIPPFFYQDKVREGWRENSIYKLDNGEIVAIFRDVTTIKNKEKELIESKEKAEESDRLKTAFLANMSHEIRTPMNGILGFIDLIKSPDLEDEDRFEFSRIIESSGHRLLSTINDILAYAEIEAGDIPINSQRVVVYNLFKSYSDFFQLETSIKGLNLKLNVPQSLFDLKIDVDTTRLDSIMNNLLKNAVKFTHQGEIEFGFNLVDDQLECYVRDTGCGISEHKLNLIFERFVQGDLSFSNGYEGTGLGLSICKAYVERLGGVIEVESVLGVGSLFKFAIPLNKL